MSKPSFDTWFMPVSILSLMSGIAASVLVYNIWKDIGVRPTSFSQFFAVIASTLICFILPYARLIYLEFNKQY